MSPPRALGVRETRYHGGNETPMRSTRLKKTQGSNVGLDPSNSKQTKGSVELYLEDGLGEHHEDEDEADFIGGDVLKAMVVQVRDL